MEIVITMWSFFKESKTSDLFYSLFYPMSGSCCPEGHIYSSLRQSSKNERRPTSREMQKVGS